MEAPEELISGNPQSEAWREGVTTPEPAESTGFPLKKAAEFGKWNSDYRLWNMGKLEYGVQIMDYGMGLGEFGVGTTVSS